MAATQAEMASVKFNHIGSIYQDLITRDFFIGPDCQTGQGPWDSSIEYYQHLSHEKLNDATRNAPFEVTDDYSYPVPILFDQLIQLYIDQRSIGGPFEIVHQDLRAHNILVNENFEILAVIDLDGFIAGPVEFQAQFPRFTGLKVEPPFQVETLPLVIQRVQRTKPKLEECKRMVQICEEENAQKKGLDPQIRPGDLMLSDAAAIVTGLEAYGMHQAFVNQRWLLSYSRLLHQKAAQKDTES